MSPTCPKDRRESGTLRPNSRTLLVVGCPWGTTSPAGCSALGLNVALEVRLRQRSREMQELAVGCCQHASCPLQAQGTSGVGTEPSTVSAAAHASHYSDHSFGSLNPLLMLQGGDWSQFLHKQMNKQTKLRMGELGE